MSTVKIPSELIAEIKRGNCVLFIGAGLSRGAGLPGWDELVRPLAIEIGVPESTDLLKAAQYYENKRGRRALLEKIIEATDTIHIGPTNNHRLMAQLPIDIWVTTNYDDLLERALQAAQRRYRTVVYDQDLPYISADRVTLVKMHGDRSRPGSIIITENDYRTYFRKYNLVKTKLSSLIVERTFLFIGYSINDPDFNQIGAEIAFELQEHGRRAYAIMFNADDFIIDDLRIRNIEVLNIVTEPGDDYSQRLGQVLQEVIQVVGPEDTGKDEHIDSIFLSYDWEDRPEARLLVEALRSRGVKITWDQDWPHWQDFVRELGREISNADVVVLYSTSHSQYGRWVRDEVKMAKQAQKRIVVLDREPGNRCDLIADEDGIDIANVTLQSAADAVIQELNPVIHQLEEPEYAGSVRELLQAALEANLGIPSDTITDKIFVSPEACKLVEVAYERAMNGRLPRNDSDRLRAVLEYGRLRRFQGEWDEAERILKRNRGFAVDDSKLYSLFCLESGALEFERGSTIEGLNRVREALGYIQRRGVTSLLVKALRQLGNMLREQGEWKEAMQRLGAAMYMAEYLKGEDSAASEPASRAARYMLWSDCIRERASLLLQLGNTDEALDQFQLALRVIEEEGISQPCEHLRGIILYQVGRGYLLQKRDVKTALEYFDTSLQILRKYDNPVRLAFLYDALGRSLTKQYPAVSLEDAQLHLEKAERIRQRCNHEHLTAYTELGLGDLYRRQGDLDSAIGAYQSARVIFSRLGKTHDLGNALLALGTTYAQMRKRRQAGKCLELAKMQFQEVNLEDKIREVEFELLKLGLRGELRDQPLERILAMGKAENYEFHLNEVGEYIFHTSIKKMVASGGTPSNRLLDIRVGIGDDAAVIGFPGSDIYDLVLNTDAAPGSICQSTAVEMGRYAAKFSVVHSLSDILAMGGTPVAVLLNMYLVRDAELEYARDVIETVIKEAKKYGAALIGGDMKERREQSIGCVGIGVVEKGKAIRRSGARLGHVVAITLAGMPDGSGVRKIGCRWAQEVIEYMKLAESEPYRSFCREKDWKRELLFLPCKEMIAGARTGLIKSAVDTSDGFLSCLQLLARESREEPLKPESGVSFEVEETLIEEIIDERVKEIAEALGFRPAQFLFNAGHDWEIVLTVEEKDFRPLQQAFRNAGGHLARLGVVRPWNREFEDGIALVSSKTGEKYWIPFFTDEKFVRRAYEERPLDWEDLKFYLEGRQKLK